MYARVTLLEIDPVRTTVESAVELYREHVLPSLLEQAGFQGVYVMATEEGKGLVLSLWSNADAADVSASSGWYANVLGEHMTLFRSPPGRERYEVMLAELPVPA
jgi:hypothetical protein